MGSGDKIIMWFYDKDGNETSLDVIFSSPMDFYLTFCTGETSLPVQPPVEVDKIWTITKTDTAINITCNDVEVLTYLFTDGKEHERDRET